MDESSLLFSVIIEFSTPPNKTSLFENVFVVLFYMQQKICSTF